MSNITQNLSSFLPREIKTIFRQAQRAYRGPGLDILLHPAQKEFGRILVVTSRKVGNAPERNRVRRRLKALFYQEKLYERNLDCIVILKKPGVSYSFDKLKDLLCSTFAAK